MAIPEEPTLAEQRARAILAETTDEWNSKPNTSNFLEKDFGKYRAVIGQKPELLRDKQGRVAGVDAWVQLFDENNREIKIDPHRRIINPPTVPRLGISEVDDVDAQGKPIKRRVLVADAKKAFYEAVRDSIESNPNPKGWRTRGTVTTVFSTTADGYIQSQSATYSTARTGGTFTVNTTMASGNTGRVGQFFSSLGPEYDCWESFFSFDTSSISDTDTVSVVQLDLVLNLDSSTTDFTVEAREKDWGASLTSADWVSGASLGSQTLLASISTSGIGATGSYKSFTSQAAFLTATNLKTGVVYVQLSSDRHRLSTTPGGSEFVDWIEADSAGTTSDPKLTITHAAPVVGPPPFTSQPNRIWTVM